MSTPLRDARASTAEFLAEHRHSSSLRAEVFQAVSRSLADLWRK